VGAAAPGEARLMREEAFGPVVVVQSVADVDAALALANSSEFGLQGACFTASLETAFKVSRKLRVGSLWINDPSRFRLDSYPLGGVGAAERTRVRAARRGLRHGGALAVEVHRPAAQSAMTAVGLIGCGGMAQDVGAGVPGS